MHSATPYLSFVTWGRNDGYTHDYVRRVNRATGCLANQLERAGVESEIIIVEWNPASGNPLLLDVLDLPQNLSKVAIRGIIVGAKHHDQLAGSNERGLHAGAAANVGIRRAKGSFVTPKANDTFLSPEVIVRIARQDLDPDGIYRVDRHDLEIPGSVWALDDDAFLAALATLPSTQHSWIEQSPYWRLRELHTNACGDFTLLGAAYWHLLRGHPVDNTVLSLDIDSMVMHAAAAHGVCEYRWPSDCKIFKPFHDNLNSARITQVWHSWQRVLDRFLANHVSLDAAHRARVWLNYPRRKVRGVPSVLGPSIERNFVRPASRWARGVYPIPTQQENWGLADEALEERILCRAG